MSSLYPTGGASSARTSGSTTSRATGESSSRKAALAIRRPRRYGFLSKQSTDALAAAGRNDEDEDADAYGPMPSYGPPSEKRHPTRSISSAANSTTSSAPSSARSRSSKLPLLIAYDEVQGMQRAHWKHAPPASEPEYLPNDLVTSRIDKAKRERALLETRVRDMVVAAMENPDPIVVVSPRASPRTQPAAPVLPTPPPPPAPAPVFTAPQAPTLPRKAVTVRRGKYDANQTFVLGGAADAGDLLSELADFDRLLKSSARRSTQQSKQPSPKGSPRHKHGALEAAPAAAATEAVAPSAQDEKAHSNPRITSANVNKRVRWKADRKVGHQRWPSDDC